MVYEHKNFVLTAVEVVPLVHEGLNDGQELPVMGLITSLSQYHFLRVISHRIPFGQIWSAD